MLPQLRILQIIQVWEFTSAVLSTTKDTVSLVFPSLTNGDAYTLTVAHVHDTSSVLGDTMFVPQTFPFFYNASVDTLVITEINYKTPLTTTSVTASDSLQYIEVYNNNSAQTRVGGYKLTIRPDLELYIIYIPPELLLHQMHMLFLLMILLL